MAEAGKVEQACIQHWEAHKSDCSGFVKAVACHLGISLTGMANDIVGQIQRAPWTARPVGAGMQAEQKAADGFFVLGGLKDEPNGHVVVVVPGPLDRGKYPTAYWGRLHSVGQKRQTLNFSWNPADRDRVIYGFIAI